jgi:hypothetical protein
MSDFTPQEAYIGLMINFDYIEPALKLADHSSIQNFTLSKFGKNSSPSPDEFYSGLWGEIANYLPKVRRGPVVRQRDLSKLDLIGLASLIGTSRSIPK